MLELEDAYYTEHKTEFHEKYSDKWLIIVGESLFGVYDTIADATKTALQHFKPGEFMMRRPVDDDLVIEVGPIIRTRYPGDDKKLKPCSQILYSDGDPITIAYV